MIPAVGYCRFSSENQADGFSIEAQKNAISEFASRMGYEIIRFYVDEAKSGTTTEGRTAFLDMLSDSKNHEFQVVIVHKLDRFARSRIDSAVSKKVLKDNGVRLISVLEQLDDSPESIILESVLEGMNEYYSKNLSRETKKGMKVAGAKGRILGTIPYGYIADKDNKFQIVYKEAENVRFIYDCFNKGMTFKALREELKKNNIQTRAGNWFNDSNLRQMLTNPTYMGDYHFGTAVYSGVVPPIVSRDLFDSVQVIIQKHKRVVPKDKGTAYLLTGLIFHSCGEAMVGYKSIKKGKAYYYYRCRKKEPKGYVYKQAIEDAVLVAVQDFFTDEKVISVYVKECNKALKDIKKSSDVGALHKRANELKTQSSKLLDLYLNGTISQELYMEKKERIDIESRLVESQISTCVQAFDLSPDIIRCAFADYADKIKSSLDNPKDTQAVLSTLIKSIKLYEDRFEITFKFGDRQVAYNFSNAPAQNAVMSLTTHCIGSVSFRDASTRLG